MGGTFVPSPPPVDFVLFFSEKKRETNNHALLFFLFLILFLFFGTKRRTERRRSQKDRASLVFAQAERVCVWKVGVPKEGCEWSPGELRKKLLFFKPLAPPRLVIDPGRGRGGGGGDTVRVCARYSFECIVRTMTPHARGMIPGLARRGLDLSEPGGRIFSWGDKQHEQ